MNPVDHVTSGVYLYGIAAFARLVAEHRASHEVYGAQAVKFANAALETMWAFMPEFDTRQLDRFVEGTIYRPRRFPTASECTDARDDAKEHVHLHDSRNFEGLSALIDDAYSVCMSAGDYAGKPLAHNEAGALMMSFIELWRALDSDLYRTSPDRQSNADLAHGMIPLDGDASPALLRQPAQAREWRTRRALSVELQRRRAGSACRGHVSRQPGHVLSGRAAAKP